LLLRKQSREIKWKAVEAGKTGLGFRKMYSKEITFELRLG
jgi:hypothetical protein